jgi:hypothetical protein
MRAGGALGLTLAAGAVCSRSSSPMISAATRSAASLFSAMSCRAACCARSLAAACCARAVLSSSLSACAT